MENKRYKIKIVVEKKENMIYFSQLDLVKVFERALRRSKLPVYFTQGFNKRIKLSFLNGLKLGVSGNIEMFLYLVEELCLEDIKKSLKKQLPKGLDILDISRQ